MNIVKKIRKNGRELRTISISTIVIAFLFILSAYLFENYQPRIETIIGAESLAGMGIYILVFILSVVFFPISSMPLIPIGAKIWGVLITTALSTVGWTLGAVIAFSLARKFGRPHVARLISIEKIEKIEKLIPEENIFLTIFFFRAVTPLDGLSYVLGLVTRVSFNTFFWSTFLGLIPFCFAVSFLGSLPVIFLILGLILAGFFLVIGIYRIKKNS